MSQHVFTQYVPQLFVHASLNVHVQMPVHVLYDDWKLIYSLC